MDIKNIEEHLSGALENFAISFLKDKTEAEKKLMVKAFLDGYTSGISSVKTLVDYLHTTGVELWLTNSDKTIKNLNEVIKESK